MKHVKYKLEKTKIIFEYYWPINSKLYQLTFNYFKFHGICYFAQCIWDYSSVVNYETVYNKVVYKYLFKAFYTKTNKKEYNLQI